MHHTLLQVEVLKVPQVTATSFIAEMMIYNDYSLSELFLSHFRLMIWLAVVDTVFLFSSCLTFSLPRLSQTYADKHWAYLLPYTLPIAQVDVTLNWPPH